MLDTLRVSKDVDTIALIEPALKSCAGGFVHQVRICFGARLEEKDISSRVFGTQVNVAKHTRSNTRLSTIEDEVGIDIDNGGFLYALGGHHVR